MVNGGHVVALGMGWGIGMLFMRALKAREVALLRKSLRFWASRSWVSLPR